MSAILSADDLNDFIAPGVACIKPVEVPKTKDYAEITIGVDGQPMEEGKELAPAQISLQDCLACSGCITSSEAMLVELQSPKELLVQLNSSEEKVFVVSVCHQTRVSLAKAYSITLETVDNKLASFFLNKLGFKYIVGTEIGRAIALQETWKEIQSKHGSSDTQNGPILSSICPGWTLYAEKTHPHVLPYLSSVRSPQQITGNLIKRLTARELGIASSQVYHLSIMPCFDKKLEASRPGFEIDDQVREVDLVITAKELVDLLKTEFETSLPDIQEFKTQIPTPLGWPAQDQWKSNVGSSSGGYLGYALTQAGPGQLLEVPGKNSDYIEFHIVQNGETVFKGAQVYGFRNIQNLVRKLKTKPKSRVSKPSSRPGKLQQISDPHSLDYIELMACPGGCARGGGQIGAPANVPSKVWTAEMNAEYNQIEQIEVTNDRVSGYFRQMEIEPTPQLLRTTFEAVKPDPSLTAALTVGTQW